MEADTDKVAIGDHITIEVIVNNVLEMEDVSENANVKDFRETMTMGQLLLHQLQILT